MEKKMGKWDIVKAMSEKVDLSQKKLGEVIDALSEVIITNVMDEGVDVNLPLLGTFKKKIRDAHEGFNPLTKQKISVPETHNITFKPTASIKRSIEPKPAKKGKK